MKRFLYIFIVLLCSQVVWASKPIQIFVQLQAPHSPYLYEMFDESVDSGRKGHLISKTSVRTAMSVFASGKFLVKLPDMASQMAAKMPKAKLWLRFRHLDDGLSKNLLKKLDDLPDGGHKFLDDFANAPDDILKKFLDNPELVEAWKVIENNPILRKKIANLEKISKWLDEGIEQQKLIDAIAKSNSKQKLIEDLGLAKSKVHVQVLIKDYENIPGVVKGRYYSNSSSMSDKASLPSGWSSELDLNQRTVETFTGKIEPFELNSGDKIYRISNAMGSSGPYWTRTKPNKLEDVIGGIAVQPEWNDFQYIYEYVIPDGMTVKAWKGKAARQQISGTIPSNYHLSGGEEQLYIPYISNQDPSFQAMVKSTRTEW